MSKPSLITCLLSFILLSSCAPKITSNLSKKYPSLDNDAPITVYSNLHQAPFGSETLGTVKVSDSGISTHCDSLTVINRIKEEARKAGGNAVQILEHKKPSIWGSSCHQMTASVFHITDAQIAAAQANSHRADSTGQHIVHTGESQIAVAEVRTLPRMRLAVNYGFGWRTAKLSNELQGYAKAYYKELMSGHAGDVSFSYYFNDRSGVGLMYASYASSNKKFVELTDTGQTGYLDTQDMITFFGPAYFLRLSGNTKWIFDLNLGIGYISYSSKQKFPNKLTQVSGGSVGFTSSAGVEYRIADSWGIGANLSTVSGIVNQMTVNENGIKRTEKRSGNQGEGLGHLKLTIGFRYYIK